MKNKTKHTPGPWNVMDTGHGYDIVGDTNQQVLVADCYPDSVEDYETPLDNELKANARLIAAAPEMLEALKQLVEHVEDHKRGKIWDIDYKGIQEAIDLARAAIAKASGK